MFVPLYATFLGEGGFALSDVPGACSPANWMEEERLSVLGDFYAEHEQHMPLLGTKPHWMPVRTQHLVRCAHAGSTQTLSPCRASCSLRGCRVCQHASWASLLQDQILSCHQCPGPTHLRRLRAGGCMRVHGCEGLRSGVWAASHMPSTCQAHHLHHTGAHATIRALGTPSCAPSRLQHLHMARRQHLATQTKGCSRALHSVDLEKHGLDIAFADRMP